MSKFLSFIFFFFLLPCHAVDPPYLVDFQENLHIPLHPELQHIPLDPRFSILRPPPARVPERSTIFIGISSYRDAQRCGRTLFLAYNRSIIPENIYIGLLDQVYPAIDGECLEEYCKLSSSLHGECKYKDQIKVDRRNPSESKGPMYARSLQQLLIGDQEFCMNIDSHSSFTNRWDQEILEDWKSINNEMGILTTYPHNCELPFYDDITGENHPPDQIMHLCKTYRRTHGFIRNGDATMLIQNTLPVMTALYGAGLVFGKCHAEKRVFIDPYQKWLFDGEEFMRSSHLFTYGYDLYTPTGRGMVVYHNYTAVPYRFETTEIDPVIMEKEKEMGINRHKLALSIPFIGLVDTNEWKKYGYGNVRSLATYREFSGAAFDQLDNLSDHNSCHQLHWIPYENATEIELLLPGWKMKEVEEKEQEGNIEMSRRREGGGDIMSWKNDSNLRMMHSKTMESETVEIISEDPRAETRTILSMILLGIVFCFICFKFYGKFRTMSTTIPSFRQLKQDRKV